MVLRFARLLAAAIIFICSALFAYASSPVDSGSRSSKVPSDSIPADRMKDYQDHALRWMQQYLQIDTTNPPGNELRAAEFFKRIFDADGIENKVFEYQPGRADIWARIPATTAQPKRPIILLNHTDVVTSDPAHWKVPPFSGAIIGDYLYGRGAQDMKDDGLGQMMAMVMLKRERVPLDRDVIFLATADEEVGDTGTDWMIANHRELLENAEFLITEGGEDLVENGKVKYLGVDVAEKAPFWIHLEAHGRPGHGSRPIENSAPNRLVRALDRILRYKTELKVLPVVEQFLRDMAPYQGPMRAKQYRNIREALKDKNFREEVENDEFLNYMLRDTIALTMLGGSQQTNVIPNSAWANLDVRLLPGEDPRKFLEQLRRVVGDPNVSVDALKPQEFQPSNASPMDTPLYDAIRQVSDHYFPGAPVTPRLTSGYTENQRYRQLGIVSYGFSAYPATAEEGSSQHGDNERIRVDEVCRGFRILYDVVVDVAGAK